MSRDNDATRDDWDESREGEYDPSPDRPRPRHARFHGSQDDLQRRNRQLPPARRRFTPAGDTSGAQRPRAGRPEPGQRPPHAERQNRDFYEDEQYRQAEPRRRQTREPRTEEEEYEQYRQYQQRQQRAQRFRTTREFGEEPAEQAGRYPRRPYYTPDDERESYRRTPSPPRRVTRREREDYPLNTPVPATRAARTRSRPPTRPATSTAREPRPQRRGWSTLLIGCAGGVITVAIIAAVVAFLVFRALPGIVPGLGIGTSSYSAQQQTLPLGISGNITQLVIQNPVGNIGITINNNATSGTLTYIKKTQATSQSNANTEFARMKVTALPGSSSGCSAASCLAITTTLPNSSNDAVDMMITLPPQNPSPTFTLSSTTQKGNVSVQNFNGLLSLSDDTGNISVTGGLLSAGSCLQARLGNVSFAGTLETTKPPAINPCYGNPINAASASNDQPWYSMKSGTGNVDATFNTLSTNVQLDVTARNQGKIIDDFNLAVKQNPDGSSNYFGPLLPNTQPAAFLTLTVDTGNITLHKAS